MLAACCKRRKVNQKGMRGMLTSGSSTNVATSTTADAAVSTTTDVTASAATNTTTDTSADTAVGTATDLAWLDFC